MHTSLEHVEGRNLGKMHKSRLSFHPGFTKMYQDVKKNFWCYSLKKNVAEYMAKCMRCQKANVELQKFPNELQPLTILEWKWDCILMNFVFGLPRTKSRQDVVWVIVDKLTKSSHFIPINIKYKLEKLVNLYISEVINLHRIPTSRHSFYF